MYTRERVSVIYIFVVYGAHPVGVLMSVYAYPCSIIYASYLIGTAPTHRIKLHCIMGKCVLRKTYDIYLTLKNNKRIVTRSFIPYALPFEFYIFCL